MESGGQELAGGREVFRLGPFEAQIWGLRHDGVRLRVGPSGGALLSSLFFSLVVVFVGSVLVSGGLNPERFTVNGWPVKNGEPFVFIGIACVGAVWVDAWRRLRQRIVATPAGLSVRHGFFRSSRLTWEEVDNIAVGHYEHSRSWDWSITVFGAAAWPLRAADFDWPIVETTSGRRISVDGLTTTGVSEGWTDGLASGAQQRVEILRRFAAQHRPPIEASLRVLPDRPRVPVWARRIGVFAASVVLLVTAMV